MPVTPAAARETHESGDGVPDFVIEVVNELIKKHWRDGGFSIKQSVIVTALLAKHGNATREQVFEQKWLDFEQAFMQHGWRIQHSKGEWGVEDSASYRFEDVRRGR
jgi:hypothetical protein